MAKQTVSDLLDTIERIRPLIAAEAVAAEANRQISPAVYWAMEDAGTKLDFPKSWLQDIFPNQRYAPFSRNDRYAPYNG
jgi:hypothetical protein